MAAYNVWQASPVSGRLANSGSRGGFRRKDIFDMEITGIKNIHPAASKASSRKGWKLADSPPGEDNGACEGGCGAGCLYGEPVPRPAEKRGGESCAGQGGARWGRSARG